MKMIILIGPQGSGNHLFSKIFSLHDDVCGWKAALEPNGYFIPHIYEPFNPYWNDPSQITADIMGGKDYAVTSVSSPYMVNYLPKIPPVDEFTAQLTSCDIDYQIVVIGRDRNILTAQQTRLRGGPTWGTMSLLLNSLETPPFFVSQELLYLYGKHYLRSLADILEFPIVWNDPRIEHILAADANMKYIQPCARTELDDYVNDFNKPPWLK